MTKEERREYYKKYYQKNKKHIAKKHEEWVKKNAEEQRIYHKSWHEENREKILGNKKSYNKKNAKSINLKKRVRRQIKKVIPTKQDGEVWLDLWLGRQVSEKGEHNLR